MHGKTPTYTDEHAWELSGSRRRFDADLTGALPDLRNFAMSLARNPVEADDLVQDCILRAIRRRHQFEPGTHLRRWLFTIIRNIHYDTCRKRKRRGTHVDISDAQPQISRPPSQDHWMHVLDVARGIEELRPCDRDVLLLSAFSRLSQKEIADRLNVAQGTVRSRLSRARATLAKTQSLN